MVDRFQGQKYQLKHDMTVVISSILSPIAAISDKIPMPDDGFAILLPGEALSTSTTKQGHSIFHSMTTHFVKQTHQSFFFHICFSRNKIVSIFHFPSFILYFPFFIFHSSLFVWGGVVQNRCCVSPSSPSWSPVRQALSPGSPKSHPRAASKKHQRGVLCAGGGSSCDGWGRGAGEGRGGGAYNVNLWGACQQRNAYSTHAGCLRCRQRALHQQQLKLAQASGARNFWLIDLTGWLPHLQTGWPIKCHGSKQGRYVVHGGGGIKIKINGCVLFLWNRPAVSQYDPTPRWVVGFPRISGEYSQQKAITTMTYQ